MRFPITQKPIEWFQNLSKLRKILLIVSIPLLILSILLILLREYKSAELKALENSASIIQLQTGREVERYIRDKHAGFTGPVYPQVLIVYEPIDNYTKEDVYAEIVAILRKNNWEGSEPNIGRDYFKAALQQGGFEISASVVIDSDKNRVIIDMIIY